MLALFFYLSLRKTKEAWSRRGSTTIAYNDFMNLKFRKTQNITKANSKLSQGEQGINKFIIVSKRRMAGLLSSSSAWSARNGSTRTPGPAVLSGKLQCRRLSRSDWGKPQDCQDWTSRNLESFCLPFRCLYLRQWMTMSLCRNSSLPDLSSVYPSPQRMWKSWVG